MGSQLFYWQSLFNILTQNMSNPIESENIEDNKKSKSNLDMEASNEENKQSISDVLQQLKEDKESKESIPELSDRNFRVENTSEWVEKTDEKGIKYLENPEGDVCEYLEGEQKGEQLFTDESALRETEKAGKTFPESIDVFKAIVEKKGGYAIFLE
jgi:hypothetical protein